MSDPLGLISGAGSANKLPTQGGQNSTSGAGQGPSFKTVLMENLNQVNELQADAGRATEDFFSGKREDYESVILAADKADTAFKMLQSMRNKVMEAYEEVKQMRV